MPELLALRLVHETVRSQGLADSPDITFYDHRRRAVSAGSLSVLDPEHDVLHAMALHCLLGLVEPGHMLLHSRSA